MKLAIVSKPFDGYMSPAAIDSISDKIQDQISDNSAAACCCCCCCCATITIN